MIGNQKKYAGKKRITISLDEQPKQFFHEDLIVIQGDKPKVLSARCPHLGCRINKIEDGKLVCPCHGSSFDMKGALIKGPAAHALEEVGYIINKETNQMVVEM